MVITAKTIRKDSNLVSLVLCLVSCVLCLAQATNTATAATYYVDASKGNDANPGTEAQPWKTLNRAYTWYSGSGTKVTEGDTVLFKNGNYGQFQEDAHDGIGYLFYRNNWITYKAATGHTPDLNNILVHNTIPGHSNGSSYLKFEGFNVNGIDSTIYATVDIGNTSYVQIIDCNIKQYALPYSGHFAPYFWPGLYAVSGINVSDVNIENCVISNANMGLMIKGTSSNIVVKNNVAHHFGEDGLDVIANNVLLENNVVYDISYYRVPINFRGTTTGSFALGDAVTLNSNPVASGIVCRVTSAVEIWQTSVQSFTDGAGEMRGTTITGPKGTLTSITNVDGAHCDGMVVGGSGVICSGIVVTGNKIIRNLPGDDALTIGCQALKLDGPQHITISNNLFVAAGPSPNVTVALLMGGGTTDFNLVNNTMFGTMLVRNLAPGPTLDINNMFNNIMSRFQIDGDGACKPRVVNHGNNIFGTIGSYGGPTYPFVVNGTELTNYNINTLFVNAANNDFNLAPNSVAINFGNPSYGPASDILGRSRDSSPDAGCYEYMGIAPLPSNSPPNADAGPDQTSTSGQITLDGSNSSDSDGNIVSYVWTEKGNQIATGVSPMVTLSPGRHIITLTVTDNDNLTDTDTVTVIVELEAGLRGYYKFDEGSGTTASDFAQISTPGRLVNGPTWTTLGEIRFAGGNDAVEISTADMKANEGTIALWAYPEVFSKNKHSLFGHTLSGGNKIQLYCNASGVLGLGLGDNPSLETGIQTLNAQEWYHIALSWDGAAYAVYVDGVQKAAGTYGGLSNLQTYADIGNNGNRSSRTEGFNGLIDEVRLYNKPLSADEINDLALVFLPIGDKTVAEGEELSFPIRTKSNVIVEISDQNLPSTPIFASNSFRWTPDYDDAGTYEVEFSAQHGSGEDFEKVAVTVLDTQQEEPIGYWNFDETNGEIASDSSSSGNNGSLKNGLAWVSGKTNGAIEFSVPNDAVEIQTSNFNPKNGTIAMWVNVTGQTLSRHYLFGHASQDLTNRIQLYLKYSQLCLGLGDSHETRTNIQLLENQIWYHIALTWSPTTYNIYINGSPKASGTYAGLTELTGHADIGNNGINRDKALNGKIDDVRIYNRALNVNEISQLVIGG